MLLDIKGVGPKILEKLNKLDIHTINDIAFFIPKTYIDFSSPTLLKHSRIGDFCFFKGKIEDISDINFKTKSFHLKVSQDESILNIYFFNMLYNHSKFSIGNSFYFYGKIIENPKYGKILTNPEFEKEGEIKYLKGIMPIYKLRGVLSQKVYLNIVKNALNDLKINSILDDFSSPLNESILKVHFPKDINEAVIARDRVLLEEITKTVLSFHLLKCTKKEKGIYDKKYTQLDFPFQLSPSQRNAIDEILLDLKSDFPMNRILLGDVGAGKTAVAFSMLNYVASCGKQGILVAPTTILAKQHFDDFISLSPYKTAFVTGDLSKDEKNRILSEFKEEKIQILIGSHSTLNFSSPNLSLAIIDEQQRFGVSQKNMVRKNNPSIDILTMTATPIPRTISLMLNDEIKISKIEREKPNIKTNLVPYEKVNDMFDYILKECEKGKQAFVICPKVYDVEGMEIFSIEKVANMLFEKFSKVGVEIIYGKISEENKEIAFSNFKEKKSKVLFATSIIEVGVDIKGVDIVAILNAELFGLSSLHQIRGRGGRGGEYSECYLCMSKDITENEIKRLKIIKNTTDGLSLAEYDFKNRGGGDFFGIRQSGKGENINENLLVEAKELSSKVLTNVDLTSLSKNIEEEYFLKIKDVINN